MWALCSIVLFGSFAVPIKTPAMQQARVHPVIIQVYKSTACFTSSWLVLLLRKFTFSYWGVVGAAIWVLNGIAAIAAVQCAGLGVSQATWSAVTIIVSFVWGTCYYHDELPHWNLALFGILLMTLGVSSVGVLSSSSSAPASSAARQQQGELISHVNYTKLEDSKGSDLEDDTGHGKDYVPRHGSSRGNGTHVLS